MSYLKKHCPTFCRSTIWLWHSPTFTTWGKYLIQSSRFILLTPLILTRFNETEIAAWYLFASLNFFGTIMAQRLGLTFSRMFAFAMGGASCLGPIRGNREAHCDASPNWKSMERAFGTIGSINMCVAWLNVAVAFAMGWFGLSNILEGYDAKGAIWLAFSIMQVTSLINFNFNHWSIVLQGMNYVALNNRWAIIFGLSSCLAGSYTLLIGGGIVQLMLVMQLVSFAGTVRAWFLLRHVEGGRVAKFKNYRFDKEIFGWAWEPAWKGFLLNICGPGSIQICAIFIAQHFDAGVVASYLFAIRMIQTIEQFSIAPLVSVGPRLSRLKALGKRDDYVKLFLVRSALALVILLVALAAFYPLIRILIKLIDANIAFVGLQAWAVMSFLRIQQRVFNFFIIEEEVGNNIVTLRERIISFFVSVLAFFSIGDISPLAYIVAALLPFIIIAAPYMLRKVSRFSNRGTLSTALLLFMPLIFLLFLVFYFFENFFYAL